MLNILGAILQTIYHCTFIVKTKQLRTKIVLFYIIFFIDYIIIQQFIGFGLNATVDVVYYLCFYTTMKLIYKDKARITDVITFVLSDLLIGANYIILSFLSFNENIILIAGPLISIIIITLIKNRLLLLEKFYNKYWNRHKNKKVLKSVTLRGFSFSLIVMTFVLIHFWLIFLAL